MSKKTKVSVTSKEFIAILADKANMSKTAAKEMYDMIRAEMVTQVVETGEFNIQGIGCIRVKDVPARTARNPKSGDTVDVAATKKVMFKASASLKAAVKG